MGPTQQTGVDWVEKNELSIAGIVLFRSDFICKSDSIYEWIKNVRHVLSSFTKN